MERMKAVIVDDEKNGRESLSSMVERFCPEVNVTGLASSALEGYELVKISKPDLVFLDIEMPMHNGFDMLEMFKNIDFSVIFTTAYDQYAVKAIKYSALDYLLKPVDPDELRSAIDKVEKRKRNTSDLKEKFDTLLSNLKHDSKRKKVAIPDGDGLVFIYVDEIIRCESDSNYTYFFIQGGKKITASRTMRDFEEMFADENFFRVHRSHLINLDHIKRYMKGDGGYVIMDDGSKVEVSRRKKNEFAEKLAEL